MVKEFLGEYRLKDFARKVVAKTRRFKMKTIKKLSLMLFLLILGYLIGSFVPVSGFFNSGPADPAGPASSNSISGNCELKVTVQLQDNSPVADLEVDVSAEPGPPLQGGSAKTDGNGIAVFHIKPGSYYIFFNDNFFPKDLEYRDTLKVTLEEGKTIARSIILYPKSN